VCAPLMRFTVDTESVRTSGTRKFRRTPRLYRRNRVIQKVRAILAQDSFIKSILSAIN
jgi:hypothetical protein